METLEVVVRDGNLILRLTPQEGFNRRLIVMPFQKKKFSVTPELQYLSGDKIVRSVCYMPDHKIQRWNPVDDSTFPIYQLGSVEYDALQKISFEAQMVRQNVQMSLGLI